MVRPHHIYSLTASCKVATFTKVDQVQEDVNFAWRQNLIHQYLKMQKISTSIFKSHLVQKLQNHNETLILTSVRTSEI